MMLTQARLRELFSYDPDTGIFSRISTPGKRADLNGKVAGFDSNGYVYVCVDYRKYPAHRLAWLYVHGVWPEVEIDHRNRIRSDNRLINLRKATHLQNTRNQSLRKCSQSGVVGVAWDSQTSKWRAHITVLGKMISLGRFYDLKDAIAARAEGERVHFGEFARAS